VFIRRQRGLAHPFVDLTLFRLRAFRVALVVNLAGAFFLAGLYLFFAQFLQLVLGYSPLKAALWSLPSAVAFVVASGFVPLLSGRWSTRRMMTVGLALTAAGFAALLFVDVRGPILLLVAGKVLASLGFTPVASLTTDVIVTAAPPARAGAAAAMSETAFELGAALGIAMLGSLGAAVYRARMVELPPGFDPATAESARATLGGAVAAAREAPDLAGSFLPAAQQAFADGYLGAAIVAVACVAALTLAVNRAMKP